MSKELAKEALIQTTRNGDRRVLRMIAESYRAYRDMGGEQDYGDFRKDSIDILAEAIEYVEIKEEEQ